MNTRKFIINWFGTIVITLSLFVSSSLFAATILSTTSGSVAEHGTTVHQIDVSAPGIITITLSGWQGIYNWSLDYDRLYVYNSAGKVVERNSSSSEDDPFLSHMMSNPQTITTRVGEAGTYYIHLHSGQAQSYSITVNFDEVIDVYEPNDTIVEATPISIGNTVSAYQWRKTPDSGVNGDEDWYKITVSTPGVMTITMSNWTSLYNWSLDVDYLYLYKSDGTLFGPNGSTTDAYSWMMGGTLTITANLSGGGTYYIRYHSGSAYSSTAYSFTVNFQNVYDVYEPNDDISQAKTISLGTSVNAYQWLSQGQGSANFGDEDWYKVTVPTPGAMTITMSGWTSFYNWSLDVDYLYLYKSDGTLLGPNGTTDAYSWMMGGTPTITANLAGGGTYYIRYHSGSAYSSTAYSFTVNFQQVNDIFESNDTSEEAKGLDPGVTAEAYQWRSQGQGSVNWGDEDYYMFTVTEACDLEMSITGWVSTFNWGLDYDQIVLTRIENVSGTVTNTEIYRSHMIGSQFSASVHADPGYYVLQLHSGSGTSTSPYSIMLSYTGVGGTSVEEIIPTTFNLMQPYPNPFNPSTTISYSLGNESNVILKIYNITGQNVATLVDGPASAGAHSVVWNAKEMPSGTYFCTIKAGKYSETRKLMLLK